MAKMMKPEVKAVRFGGADVIATSALTVGNRYYTKGAEVNEAYGNSDRKSGANYTFIYNGGSSTNLNDLNDYDSYTNGNVPYAWYNGSSWYTDGIKYSEADGKEWEDSSRATSYTYTIS
ncbi:MAG: hypothetical protein IJ836_09045 [Spirochaetales bacterium]|nr:hypothetical protein [Spirochaetales bacterium]